MKNLSVDFENCYGIKKLKYKFDFSKKSTYAIYAPNGIMKTSFAKTFLDLSNDRASVDSIFKARKTKREIKDETGAELTKEQVFVVVPYNQEFKSQKISTLLVNKEMREKYEKVHADIDEKKAFLITELEALAGMRGGVEESIAEDFTHNSKEFFTAIQRVKAEVYDKKEPIHSDIIYERIFNDKVIAFLQTKDFKTKLTEYISKYNELIDSSTYFKKGVFNHNNAATIAKNLKENGFFKAQHAISLNSKDKSKIISSEEELEEVIKSEKDQILNNPDLVKAFEDIDKAITKNQELRGFRDYIENVPEIIPELSNLDALKQKLWISYLKKSIDAFKALEVEHTNGQEEIEKIVAQAKKEETQWRTVVNEFNKRFFVPFKLSVENQEDVILKSDGPSIKFIFQDTDGSTSIEEKDLFNVLSNGELRALYILNIIFEVEARTKMNLETLFVVDDIADSFDYKNKYAIIEYLKDISNKPNFKQIILTHNFDFYRTVSSRLDMGRQNKLNTVKTSNGIELVEEKYQKNPFDTWKNEFHKVGQEAMLIASIPFVRNIAEYAGYDNEFTELTSLLHIKERTDNITKKNLEDIFKAILKDKHALILSDPGKSVKTLIIETAENILIGASEIIELENKIVLAIAIRLKAEQFMVKKINNDAFWKSITTNQTFSLIEKYKTEFPAEIATIELLEQVNLMTPENIHLNSFMYEPIIDMSNQHLKQLYSDVSKL